MTRDEVLAMKPGRELDALVWLMLNDKPLDDLIMCRRVDGDVQPHAGYPVGHISPPQYSTNEADAWGVVDKIQDSGVFHVGISYIDRTDGHPLKWCVDFDGVKYRAWADSAAEAICKAGLLYMLGRKKDD